MLSTFDVLFTTYIALQTRVKHAVIFYTKIFIMWPKKLFVFFSIINFSKYLVCKINQ